MMKFLGLTKKSTEIEEVSSQTGSVSDGNLHIGQKVTFFQGRRPLLGIIQEKMPDGRYEIVLSDGRRLVKEEDEVRPYGLVKNKKANIRFIR